MFKKILCMVLAVVMLVGVTFMLGSCGNEKKDIKAALICLHGDSSTYDKNFIDAFKQACAIRDSQRKTTPSLPVSPRVPSATIRPLTLLTTATTLFLPTHSATSLT